MNVNAEVFTIGLCLLTFTIIVNEIYTTRHNFHIYKGKDEYKFEK